MDTNEPLRWLLGRGVALLVGTVVLLVVYRVGVTAIHRVVPAVIHAQATHLPSGSSSEDEVGKRITTIEDLLLRLLRVGVLAGLVVMVLAVLEWWNLLAAIVLVIVAIVFATRDVVLDYVMGFLILIEGPFFKGDYVVVNGHPGVEGVVEEIGLRRTHPARRDGVVACRLERVHPAVVQPDPAVLGRRRGLARSASRRPRSRPGDRGPGRGRDAWGSGVGGHVPRRCPDRDLGHRDRPRWTLHQAPAASLDRRPGSRRRASFVDGWSRRWPRSRSGRGGWTRPCRS